MSRRVYEIAKDMGISTSELVGLLKEAGIKVSAVAVLSEKEVREVIEIVNKASGSDDFRCADSLAEKYNELKERYTELLEKHNALLEKYSKLLDSGDGK